MLVELNVNYPGGLAAVRREFYALWEGFAEQADGWWPPEREPANLVEPRVPDGLALIAPKLYQCVLSREALREMVLADQRHDGRPPTIFRVWPDYPLSPQIDRSAPTVKADAAWQSYGARGKGIVWAVIDTGIDATHPHFSALELAHDSAAAPDGKTSRLHRDFSYYVDPATNSPAPGGADDPARALVDEAGHGTHVAGIIAGCTPAGVHPQVAESNDPGDGGYVPRAHVNVLSGMAPECELLSIKVMRRKGGVWVSSSSAVIRALTYLRTEVNIDPGVPRVHGVNMSLGVEWEPGQYAAGQSPLCQAVNQLVAAGVVVVVSAGNNGASAPGDSSTTSAVLGSITEPAHAEDCIAVGSTHRDAPHAFGVTWTSGKGPTLDGRRKPDVVAPGEWISSAATGEIRARAGFAVPPGGPDCAPTYAEQSGTSMAAPHVSGVVAAFLSARPEFIGRPRLIKDLLTASAVDLGRERYAQGAGLVDLMRMLAGV
ncbi:S8 family serine peptidase [Amycolatopsis acidicola]|uniref:S8 family serine peptidase n=2 Tax=Amycolatopsis acidicola TaxID=2596893 RepID=A0A5N0UYL3_9PSEU|nr:S8 family serine peptidase [Amycolatopsis acidicola]